MSTTVTSLSPRADEITLGTELVTFNSLCDHALAADQVWYVIEWDAHLGEGLARRAGNVFKISYSSTGDELLIDNALMADVVTTRDKFDEENERRLETYGECRCRRR